MIATPRSAAARTKLQQAATTSSAPSVMFRYATNTWSGHTGFMHANKSSDFASMVDFGENDTTCSQASLRLASEQVSDLLASRSRTC